MTILPIAERELRVAARHPRLYWGRCAAGFLATLLGGLVLWINSGATPPREMGQYLFRTLGTLAFIGALFAGCGNTYDCLSWEKRQGTLGLLFLTDLKGHDVVIGKLLAMSLNAFMGLLALAPILALPLLLGGMTWTRVGLVTIVLINTLFFSQAMALFVSALTFREGKALLGTWGGILLVTVGIPALSIPWSHYVLRHSNSEPVEAFLFPSPGYGFVNLVFGTGGLSYKLGWSLLAVHALAWLLLGLAGWLLPRRWQDRPMVSRSQWDRRWWQFWRYGDAGPRQARRREQLEINPVLWLVSRERFASVLLWGCLGLIVVGWMAGWIENGKEWLTVPLAILTASILHGLLKICLASESARFLEHEKREGTLEVILCTPLQVDEIVRGVLLALLDMFGPLTMAIVVADIFLLLGGLQEYAGMRQEQLETAAVFFVGLVTLVVDLYALSWVGLWLGSRLNRLNQARSLTFFLVVVAPWLVLMAASILDGLISAACGIPNATPNIPLLGGLFLWLFFCVLWDGLLILWSRNRLTSQLRLIARQRYMPAATRAWWAWWRS